MSTTSISAQYADSEWLATRQNGQPLSAVLKAIPHGVGALTWGQRFDILDAWVSVLDDLYAHLPLKRALYGFDPIRAIERLRMYAHTLTDLEFHRELTTLINRLRDAHTQYTGPTTLSEGVATLPFLVEAFGPSQSPSYVVTKVNRSRSLPDTFEPGVTLESWNGIPFDRAVDIHAEVETGGRPSARRARALESLTFRALGEGPPPDELWVIIGYRDRHNKPQEVRLDWHVVLPGRSPRASGNGSSRGRRAVDHAAEAVRRAKKLMFNGELWRAEHVPPGAGGIHAGGGGSSYEDFLTASEVEAADGRKLGYLRIWSFDVDDDQAFLDAAIKMLEKLPKSGLIIDLRDNPGGFIWAAERMLQLFTPHRITPTKFALRATRLTAAMAKSNQSELGAWASSLADAAMTGEPYSSHLPITSVEQCNDLGQHYGGPIVVIVNANTYSSGDLFAAGIVDNRIGTVVSIGDATGAGGANVWTSDDVHLAMVGAGYESHRLPGAASFRIAVRRAVRSGDADGVLIEDSGIPGREVAMTKADVMNHNADLIEHCATLLAAEPVTEMALKPDRDNLFVMTAGLDRLDVYLDGHPFCPTISIKGGIEKISIGPTKGTFEVVGYSGGEVRQRRRISRK